jgi:hypothetical protein
MLVTRISRQKTPTQDTTRCYGRSDDRMVMRLKLSVKGTQLQFVGPWSWSVLSGISQSRRICGVSSKTHDSMAPCHGTWYYKARSHQTAPHGSQGKPRRSGREEAIVAKAPADFFGRDLRRENSWKGGSAFYEVARDPRRSDAPGVREESSSGLRAACSSGIRWTRRSRASVWVPQQDLGRGERRTASAARFDDVQGPTPHCSQARQGPNSLGSGSPTSGARVGGAVAVKHGRSPSSAVRTPFSPQLS